MTHDTHFPYHNRIVQALRFRISQSGLTLIELMVVMGIGILISTTGIVAFSRLSYSQTVVTAQADVVSFLSLAKSRAQSQVKPASCTVSRRLEGYRVTINRGSGVYSLQVLCGGQAYDVSGYTNHRLPPQVTFHPPTPSAITFAVLTGDVTGAGRIVIRGFGQMRTIDVGSNGTIVSN